VIEKLFPIKSPVESQGNHEMAMEVTEDFEAQK
jgi:hypothetical protein